ncbi:MAG TPA: hypothetical protein VF432_04610 [Thermoanaerobaculia bacterium]
MNHRWPLLFCAFIALTACTAHYTSTESVGTPIRVSSNIPDCPIRDVALATPASALFIGVTNYPEPAGVFSTPAHFIGANLFAGVFSRAADRQGPSFPYDSETLTDLARHDALPPNYADPMKVISTLGFGGGGSGHAVLRKEIEAALAGQAAAAEGLYEKHGQALLVVYVAAHGFLVDGEPYFLPSDAVADKSETWISYRSVIDSAAAFLGRNAPGSKARSALLIFDTCQVRRGGAGVPPAEFAVPPGLVLVQSAAPGQYAWHWTASSKYEYDKQMTKEVRLGIGLPPKEARGHIQGEQAATMSVLPIASQCFLADAIKAHKQNGGADEPLTVREWFTGLKAKADGYFAEIPEMQALGRSQTISIRVAEGQVDPPLFVLRQSPPPEP